MAKQKEIKIKSIYLCPKDNRIVGETVANWIFDRQLEKYKREKLYIAYLIWIRIKSFEDEGIKYNLAKKMAIQEYFENKSHSL